MKRLFATILLLLLTGILHPATETNKQIGPASQNESTVVFAVWAKQKDRPETPLIDPIVVLNAGKIRTPPEYDYANQAKSDRIYAAFDNRYYRRGQVYPVLIGGAEAGRVVVTKPINISCVSHVASAKLQSELSGGSPFALAATSIHPLTTHPNWGRPAAPSEKEEFLRAADGYFNNRRIASRPSSLKIRYLRTTRLGTGQQNSLIGSVSLRKKNAIHFAFLVVSSQTDGPAVVLDSYHRSIDMRDAIDSVEEIFVDQLDLDGDGTDEIITRSTYYESWDYSIYEQQHGMWKRVYKGAGGGC